jgi:prophage regulatory protein
MSSKTSEAVAHQQGRLLRLSQVLELIPVSPATWWRGVKSGRYPKPIKLGPMITAWREQDVRALVEGTK